MICVLDNINIQDGEMFFYVKDYQGNVRVVLDQNNQPVELNSYYPYGGLMATSATEGTQPYKYSGKELDRENGLDLYDSQARWYDPMLARTTTLDPLAEKYYSMSPYMWCAGNPVKYVDPTGETLHISNFESYQILTHSLPLWSREYVIMDENGYVDKEIINNELLKCSQSVNIQALISIVNDSRVVDFDATSTSFHYYNSQSDKEESYLFEAPTRINDFKQLMDAYDGDPNLKDSYAAILKSKGIEDMTTVNGNMGQALRPREAQTEYPSPKISISSNFQVYINPVGTTLLERVKAVGHELFGHIYMSLIGKDPRHGKNNSQLEEFINERERESISNFLK